MEGGGTGNKKRGRGGFVWLHNLIVSVGKLICSQPWTKHVLDQRSVHETLKLIWALAHNYPLGRPALSYQRARCVCAEVKLEDPTHTLLFQGQGITLRDRQNTHEAVSLSPTVIGGAVATWPKSPNVNKKKSPGNHKEASMLLFLNHQFHTEAQSSRTVPNDSRTGPWHGGFLLTSWSKTSYFHCKSKAEKSYAHDWLISSLHWTFQMLDSPFKAELWFFLILSVAVSQSLW